MYLTYRTTQRDINDISPQQLKLLESTQNELVSKLHDVIGDHTNTLLNTTMVLCAHEWSKSKVLFRFNELLSKVLETSDEIPKGFYFSHCLRPNGTEKSEFAIFPKIKTTYTCSLCSKSRKEGNCRRCSCCKSHFCGHCFHVYMIGRVTSGAVLIKCPSKTTQCVGVFRSESFIRHLDDDGKKTYYPSQYKKNLSKSFFMSQMVDFCQLRGCGKMLIRDDDDDEYSSEEESGDLGAKKIQLCDDCKKIPKEDICFQCKCIAHQPIPCHLMDYWLKNHRVDEYVVIKCPKCGEKIYRSGLQLPHGRFHECRKCKQDFCIMCRCKLTSDFGKNRPDVNRSGGGFHKLKYKCKDTTKFVQGKPGQETIVVYDGSARDFENFSNFIRGFMYLEQTACAKLSLMEMSQNLKRGKNILFIAQREMVFSCVLDMIFVNNPIPSDITDRLEFRNNNYVENVKVYFERKKKAEEHIFHIVRLLNAMSAKSVQDVDGGEVDRFFKHSLELMTCVKSFNKHVSYMTNKPISQIQFKRSRNLMKITKMMKKCEWLEGFERVPVFKGDITTFQQMPKKSKVALSNTPYNNYAGYVNERNRNWSFERDLEMAKKMSLETFGGQSPIEKAKELSLKSYLVGDQNPVLQKAKEMSLNTHLDQKIERAKEMSQREQMELGKETSQREQTQSKKNVIYLVVTPCEEMEEIIRNIENFISRSTDSVTEVINDVMTESLRNEKLMECVFDSYRDFLMSYHDHTAQGKDANAPLQKLVSLFRFIQCQTDFVLREKKYRPTGKSDVVVEIKSKTQVRQYTRKFGAQFNLKMERGGLPKQRFDRTVTFVVGGEDYVSMSEKMRIEWNMKPVVVFSTHPDRKGGNYKRGFRGREEELCRRSNYTEVLGRVKYPVDEHGGVYFKDLSVFRKSEKEGYKFTPRQSEICAISVSAMRMRGNNVGNIVEKLRIIFKIAIENEHDAVIMTECGVGKLGMPPDAVAKLVSSVVKEFQGFFRSIVFTMTERDVCKEESGRTLPSFEKYFGILDNTTAVAMKYDNQ